MPTKWWGLAKSTLFRDNTSDVNSRPSKVINKPYTTQIDPKTGLKYVQAYETAGFKWRVYTILHQATKDPSGTLLLSRVDGHFRGSKYMEKFKKTFTDPGLRTLRERRH